MLRETVLDAQSLYKCLATNTFRFGNFFESFEP
jgi:hypothetical protein